MLRGGGGNFGVVTSFQFRAHPVSTVLAGPTFWPLEQTAEVMRFYREFLPAAPRELNGFFATMTVPPADLFPADLHLRKVCGVMWCYTGPEDAAADLFAPVQQVGTPLLHGVAPMPYPALQGLFDPFTHPACSGIGARTSCASFRDAAIDQHLRFAERLPTKLSTMHLYPIDGAVHDTRADETPFSYRDVNWAEVIVGVDPGPRQRRCIRDWTVDYWDATHAYSAGGAYVNFMMDEGDERVRATYGENYGRLAAAKARYDPANTFRVNQNIAPSAAADSAT